MKYKDLKATTKTTKKTPKTSNSFVIEYSWFYLVFTCVTKTSENDKTGNMIQSYLIDKERINEKRVYGTHCEKCNIVDKCYVQHDKVSVRGALKKLIGNQNTSYHFVTLDQALTYLQISNKKLRMGSYGDPSALPLSDLEKIKKAVKGRMTSYTHFWREIPTQYRRYCMASVETPSDRLLAESLGYRCYVVTKDDEEVDTSLVICPNYTHNVTCDDCMLCDGAKDNDKRKSITHPLH